MAHSITTINTITNNSGLRAPPRPKRLFLYPNIIHSEEFKDGNLILMVDLNSIININLDRTGHGGACIPNIFKDLIKNHLLVDLVLS